MGATPYLAGLQIVHLGCRLGDSPVIGRRFLKTSAGLRPSAVKVPASPNTTVTASAVNAAAPACPATQANGNSITRVTIKAAAIEPMATPNTTLIRPIKRYSTA